MLTRNRLLKIVMLLQKLLFKTDYEDDEISHIIAILLRKPKNSVISMWAKRKLVEFRRIERSRRLSIRGFFSLVWRYPDVQFKEDFRMTRELFEVKKSYLVLNIIDHVCFALCYSGTLCQNARQTRSKVPHLCSGKTQIATYDMDFGDN